MIEKSRLVFIKWYSIVLWIDFVHTSWNGWRTAYLLQYIIFRMFSSSWMEFHWKCRFSVQMISKVGNTFSLCNQCLKTENVAFDEDAMLATIVAHSISFTCILCTQRIAYKPWFVDWVSCVPFRISCISFSSKLLISSRSFKTFGWLFYTVIVDHFLHINCSVAKLICSQSLKL